MDTFAVPAGTTTQWQGDVTIQCNTATVEGDLVAVPAEEAGSDGGSITIEATGDVTVTGSIAAGAGVAGADRASGDNGGNGGNGGSITIESSGGDVTVGAATGGVGAAQAGSTALTAGDGGNGGSGKLGGNGGTGGHIFFSAASGTLTVNQRAGLLHVGNGGNGGNGSVSAAEAATFTLPAQLPGAGGDSGYVAAAYTTLEGAELVEADCGEGPTTVPILDEGVASGGQGGDAGSFQLGAEVGTGARPAGSGADRAVCDTRQETRVEGASGGHGATTGGDGQSVSVSLGHETYPAGEPGRDVVVLGGGGGTAGLVRPEGAVNTFVFVFMSPDLHGGNGGDASARAANGAAGGPGQDGGEGGEANAYGGAGGSLFWETANGGAFPGNGGRATAYGGHGGDGGDGGPEGSGGSGGKGGGAIASGGRGGSIGGSSIGEGGDASATAGDGGDGGDGRPGGNGSDGGAASARGGAGIPEGSVLRSKNGTGGTAGRDLYEGGTKQYGTLAGDSSSHGGSDGIHVYRNWVTGTVNSQDADAMLGGPNHPLMPCDGQSMYLTAGGSQLWCAGYGQGVCRFSNPLTGGDRAPNVCLTNGGTLTNGPGVSVWVDETRNVLYATSDNSSQILAWNNASSIASDVLPSRTMTVTGGLMVRCIVGDAASDRLFIIREKDGQIPELAVLDGASQRNGSAPASRVISGIQPGPYGLAYDAAHDLLYVGISDGGTLGVARLANASTTTNATGSPVLTGAATGIGSQVTHLAVFPDTDLLFVGVSGGNLLAFEDADSISGNVAPLKQEKLATFMVSGLVWESG